MFKSLGNAIGNVANSSAELNQGLPARNTTTPLRMVAFVDQPGKKTTASTRK